MNTTATVKLPKELHKKMKIKIAQEDLTIQELLVNLVNEWVLKR